LAEEDFAAVTPFQNIATRFSQHSFIAYVLNAGRNDLFLRKKEIISNASSPFFYLTFFLLSHFFSSLRIFRIIFQELYFRNNVSGTSDK
jgi:hypothetical protein